MSYCSGTKLGPYEIQAPLGDGGMGEVYRARDTRLGRSVAIKILPPAFATDHDRLNRFQQEARAASVLNHPNIVTIYELGEDTSTHYIAMELVEGSTLRDLLLAGPIPIRKALEIATQVAEALAKAHDAGITHRDLKPENLMLSKDGLAKILDFGLAKLVHPSGELPDLCTMPALQTQPGLVLGTVQYMSPEQASARELDFRSDQFSFGLVLYEMVTGKHPFRKDSPVETLAAILREQPEPVAVQNPEAPAPLCWLIERCLAKEREQRYISTRDLARELVAIRDHLLRPPAKQVELHPSNLPVQRTGFVGREKEIEAAKELVQQDEVRLVTITGPGGIGKTRLAIEVAGGLLENFSGGVYFVPLSSVSDSGLIASAIVQTVGIRGAGGKPPLEILKGHFQDAIVPTLLLLDNFEHLLPAAATVSELLAMSPDLKILVTSRAALHVYGEHDFPVPPLALPDPQALPPLHVLAQYSAVSLFVQRAVAAKPGFELNRENAAAVAEICSRLDGLPLAIELAAARVKVLSPSSLQARLASRLQLLTGGARDLPQRQQTLRATIDWSYGLLNPAEQKLFRRLSVFVGGCTLEGVEAVCDAKGDLELDLLDGMASMVDKSLLQQVGEAKGESRFAMLETIREYALDRLEAGGEKALTRRAHAAYCLVLAEEADTEQSDAADADWLDRCALEHDNFRAALEWLTETGDAEWGLRLGSALFHFWETREHFGEGREWLIKLLKLPGSAAPTRPRARALFAAGVLAGDQGDYASGNLLIRESLDIFRRLRDKQGIGVALNALAAHAMARDESATACALFEESLALWREVGDRKAVARALSNLANGLKFSGDYARAHSIYEECLTLFQELGDRAGIAWTMNHQGDVARQQEDWEMARTWYERALAAFRELGDSWGTGSTLADLGGLAREQKNYSAAYPLYRESLRMFQELGHKRGIARLLECFACSSAAQLQAERSLRLAGAAAALRQHIGVPLTPAEQVKMEALLDPPRHALTQTEGTAAWLKGWATPLEKAIEEVLALEPASRGD